jgi:hypothetical protein
VLKVSYTLATPHFGISSASAGYQIVWSCDFSATRQSSNRKSNSEIDHEIVARALGTRPRIGADLTPQSSRHHRYDNWYMTDFFKSMALLQQRSGVVSPGPRGRTVRAELR